MKSNRKTYFIIMLAVILLIGYLLIYIKPDRYYDGFSNIVDKNRIGNNYFIYVDNEFADTTTKLECTDQQYDNVVIDDQLQYHIAYEYNSHSPQKGKLITLDFDNTIDNRTSEIAQ